MKNFLLSVAVLLMLIVPAAANERTGSGLEASTVKELTLPVRFGHRLSVCLVRNEPKARLVGVVYGTSEAYQLKKPKQCPSYVHLGDKHVYTVKLIVRDAVTETNFKFEVWDIVSDSEWFITYKGDEIAASVVMEKCPSANEC